MAKGFLKPPFLTLVYMTLRNVARIWWGFAPTSLPELGGASPRSRCSQLSLVGLRPDLLQNASTDAFLGKPQSATLVYMTLRNVAQNQWGFAPTSFPELSGAAPKPHFCQLSLVGLRPELIQMAT